MFKSTTAISLTSIVTRIAQAIGALAGQDIEYISTPRLIVTEQSLIQGHHLKYNAYREIMYYFPGYTNKIRLPNPALRLYESRSLTFELRTIEEGRRSVSGRSTRRRPMQEVGSSSQQPPSVPTEVHSSWETPGYTPGYDPRWETPQQEHTTGGGWQTAKGSSWRHAAHGHSSDSEGLPPPLHPHPTHGIEALTNRVGGLEIRTGEIQETLTSHVQDSALRHQQHERWHYEAQEWHQQNQLRHDQHQQWQLQQQQQWEQTQAMLRQQREAQEAYWRSLGYNPGP